MTCLRRELVELHREAYRHRGQPYAEALIAAEQDNLTPDELIAVLSGVAEELEITAALADTEMLWIQGNLD